MFKNRRILIFSGGTLDKWALEYIKEEDFLVGVDRGALFLLRNNLKPHFAVGDFDSVNSDEFGEIRKGCKDLYACDPVLKDHSDTELAFNWALDRRPEEIILLGVTGSRFDHTLANVHLLNKSRKKGICCKIIDENNEIILIDGFTSLEKGLFPYVSLLPFSSRVTGITLEGFQYPLFQATLDIGDSLAISNVLKEEKGSIQIETGQLLVIRSKD